MDLKDFCEKHRLDYPDNPIKFEIRPAFPSEAGFFYALPPDEDARLGTIGHVRIDFGRGGDRFWHTWWPRGPEELNSSEFKGELEQVMNQLRRGVLKDLTNMRRWCHEHGGEIGGGWSQNYGYIVETEHYRCRSFAGHLLSEQQLFAGGRQRLGSDCGFCASARHHFESRAVFDTRIVRLHRYCSRPYGG